MSKHRFIAYQQPLPEDFLDALQEFLGSQAANFKLGLANPTTLRVVAGADNDQVAIAINGRWRYISATITAAHPGGAAGSYDVFVTASDNSFTAGGPAGETDNTVYTFGLQILATGNVPSTALYRKIATVLWSGTAIIQILPITAGIRVDALFAMYDSGTLAARPAAGLRGRFYLATDQTPEQVFFDDGTAWIAPWADAAYRTVLEAQGYMDDLVLAGPNPCGSNGKPFANGVTITSFTAFGIPILDIHAAELAVPGKTPKLSLSAVLGVNAVAPTTSYTFQLVPLTAIGGAAGNLTLTTGAAVASAIMGSPAANSLNRVNGADQNLPADGQYLIAVTVTGGSPAAGTRMPFSVQARLRYV